MSLITVGIVDYGLGNHASVIHALRELGFRVVTSHKPDVLDNVDVMVLPGVGAFPAAMNALYQRNLVDYLKEQSLKQRPIIGICLGMQLLTTASYEFTYTLGLNIIPGEFSAIPNSKYHIGWNSITSANSESWLQESEGQDFYFNHSFHYDGPSEYVAAYSNQVDQLVAIIRKNFVVGVQFHPEKSQAAGGVLLKNLVMELTKHA